MVGEWHPADGCEWDSNKFECEIWLQSMCGTYRLPSQREAKQQQIPSSYDEKCERFYVKSIFQSPVNRSQKLKKSLSAHHKKSNDSYDTKLRQEQICSLFDISFVGARHRFSLCFCFHFSKTIFFIAFLPLHCKSLRLFDCSVRLL